MAVPATQHCSIIQHCNIHPTLLCMARRFVVLLTLSLWFVTSSLVINDIIKFPSRQNERGTAAPSRTEPAGRAPEERSVCSLTQYLRMFGSAQIFQHGRLVDVGACVLLSSLSLQWHNVAAQAAQGAKQASLLSYFGKGPAKADSSFVTTLVLGISWLILFLID